MIMKTKKYKEVMKKYIVPEMEITSVNAVQMMCLSVVDGSADDSPVLSKDRTMDFASSDNTFEF